MLPESLNLEIVTPEKRLVSTTVDEVVMPGSEGSLGVLPGHAPLLTGLSVGVLSYRKASARHYLAIAWGFAEVLPDKVSVLAEIAERGEDIDRERAERARDRALERLKSQDPDVDFKRAQVALEKAVIRLQASAHARGESI
jgi:F-type H+-transporting ATPase subunit epsilon